jgi:hypothetical protein
MLRRVVATFRYAVREEDFLNIFGAGVALAIIGTISYTLGATGIPSTRSTSRWRR